MRGNSRHCRDLLIIGVLLAEYAIGQSLVPTTTLTGRVVDDSTGAPLFMANVFVAGSLVGASTDTLGGFTLKLVPMGSVEIVASLVGYKPQSISLRVISSYQSALEFRLKQSLIQLQPVVIDASEWKTNFEKFTRLLIGYSANAKECEIQNPGILDFTQTDEPGAVRVDFSGPLEIENKALGYKLFYYLNEFVMHKEYVRYEGMTEYHQLKPKSADEQKEWSLKRETAYKGSLQHFLSALMAWRLEEVGVSAYMVESVCLTNLQKKAIDPEKILSSTEIPYEKRLSFDGFIEVRYARERADPGFRKFMRLQGASANYDALLRVQTSWIKMNKPNGIVRIDGVLADPYALITYGYWSFERVADMLPLDYKPVTN